MVTDPSWDGAAPHAVGERRSLVVGEQLVDRHVVEAGQPLQAGHRDGPLAPLVGPQHRGLELLARGGLDLLQRQPLLPPDQAQAFADLPPVRGWDVRRLES